MWLVRVAQWALLLGVVSLAGVGSLDARLEGDLALELRVASMPRGRGRWHRVPWGAGRQDARELLFRMSEQRQKVTAATSLECVYKYPEKAQVDALLSNMMNELAKVFVRANEYMKSLDTRRHDSGLKQASQEDSTLDIMLRTRRSNETELVQERREPEREHLRDKGTRFKIVHGKQKPFFDLIYSNMTEEYRNFYNTTFERVDRAGGDPCLRQDEIKQLWRSLLKRAREVLRSAAQRCVDAHLAATPAHDTPQVRKHLQKFLRSELSKMRANQLNMLCDTYQLCYSDLLE
ncbi:hypothetical protein PYW07_014132 [Mythimna separata]|uniref:Uncharacterized protein n=1 Tax=Mythimna separata TaxID=271217 RepID=A0AAD8DP87_MYTSE|nr:hypothetical protein PYW07_014132 [Mythimna separata]